MNMNGTMKKMNCFMITKYLTIWRIGILIKMMKRSMIPTVVGEAVSLMIQTVLHVNTQTSSTATPLESVFTRNWCVMAIPIQAVVGMMKAFITATNNTTKEGLSRDMPP